MQKWKFNSCYFIKACHWLAAEAGSTNFLLLLFKSVKICFKQFDGRSSPLTFYTQAAVCESRNLIFIFANQLNEHVMVNER